ncbi:nucleotide-binding universal stress UspA family protein [Actinoplanes lutulentus]|uniref:Universal stress protein family protein n=1 Tax=Actinoplanes lutulentus TaxID=1287878 RepID=A0A327ZJX4_9ACTN|nr:universal stress protein [Actinoplanes lutulentus]MBB2940832.1 nucleotide-binding universal stress UspA family protein [Actinoplanes lutulentus]RAK43142.1 universal stress protein family protein [Actinoplanes lutulentus]
MRTPTPTVVVGTDGAVTGNDAVRWAAREAARRHVPLRVVHVLDWDGGTSALSDFAGNDFALAQELAGIVAAAGVSTARDAAPDVDAEPFTLSR